MPTVHRLGPYRFYFFSEENDASHEPPHIHVRSGDGVASLWLAPVRIRDFQGYTPREVERIRRIVVADRALLMRRWHEFLDQRP
jgi:hypothetical protein